MIGENRYFPQVKRPLLVIDKSTLAETKFKLGDNGLMELSGTIIGESILNDKDTVIKSIKANSIKLIKNKIPRIRK